MSDENFHQLWDAADRFYLIPSRHQTYLPELEITCRSFVGMVPLPWRIETPNASPMTGILLLWVSEHGIFNSESVSPNADWNEIAERVNEIVRSYEPDKSKFKFTGIL